MIWLHLIGDLSRTLCSLAGVWSALAVSVLWGGPATKSPLQQRGFVLPRAHGVSAFKWNIQNLQNMCFDTRLGSNLRAHTHARFDAVFGSIRGMQTGRIIMPDLTHCTFLEESVEVTLINYNKLPSNTLKMTCFLETGVLGLVFWWCFLVEVVRWWLWCFAVCLVVLLCCCSGGFPFWWCISVSWFWLGPVVLCCWWR